MDKVGRLVLPKRIREAIGIEGCMVINVEVVDNTALSQRRSKAVA